MTTHIILKSRYKGLTTEIRDLRASLQRAQRHTSRVCSHPKDILNINVDIARLMLALNGRSAHARCVHLVRAYLKGTPYERVENNTPLRYVGDGSLHARYARAHALRNLFAVLYEADSYYEHDIISSLKHNTQLRDVLFSRDPEHFMLVYCATPKRYQRALCGLATWLLGEDWKSELTGKSVSLSAA